MDEITTAFYLIMKIAKKEGVSEIGRLPGLWEYQVDENWRFKVNGHDHDVDGVPPFHALILYNDLPAGLISPFGGVIADGAAANEDAFIAAMQKRIEEKRRLE